MGTSRRCPTCRISCGRGCVSDRRDMFGLPRLFSNPRAVPAAASQPLVHEIRFGVPAPPRRSEALEESGETGLVAVTDGE